MPSQDTVIVTWNPDDLPPASGLLDKFKIYFCNPLWLENLQDHPTRYSTCFFSLKLAFFGPDTWKQEMQTLIYQHSGTAVSEQADATHIILPVQHRDTLMQSVQTMIRHFKLTQARFSQLKVLSDDFLHQTIKLGTPAAHEEFNIGQVYQLFA